MVSGAKLKRSESVLHAIRPYFNGLDSVLNNLLSGTKAAYHPLLEERAIKDKIALCVVTSDTGLCSTYNDNIIRLAEGFISKYGREKVKLVTVGKKAAAYFKKRDFTVTHSYLGLSGRFSYEAGEGITEDLTRIFLSKAADEVYIVYTQFISGLKYKPAVEKFLNIERREGEDKEYIFEPAVEKILEDMLPRYILIRIKYILLNSFAAEHSARMIAMKAATDNSQELIDNLTLLRNKARQGLITKEIIEVSSAAEALKG